MFGDAIEVLMYLCSSQLLFLNTRPNPYTIRKLQIEHRCIEQEVFL